MDTPGLMAPVRRGLLLRTLKVYVYRMPRRMRDGDLTLRRLTLLDGPDLAKLPRGGGIIAGGGGRNPTRSWLSLYRSLRTALPVAYCIVCGGKTVGLAGLYDIRAGESAGMSLEIFDGNYRRKGYGRRTFALLTGNLERQRLVGRVFVEVKEDNQASLSFWMALGFTRGHSVGKTRRLSLPLRQPGDLPADRPSPTGGT